VTAFPLRTLPRAALLALCCLGTVPAFAQQQPIVVQGLDCRGEEPFWRVDANRMSAQYSSLGTKGKREVVFRGALQTISFLTPPITVWRGDSTHLPKETLVLTLKEEACQSTMKEGPARTHRAILSLKAGEAATGCCTIKAGYDARVAPVANLAKKNEDDWARFLPDLLAGINFCLARDGSKAKWISEALPMNQGMGLVRVVRTDGKSVDCVADLTGRGKIQFNPVNPADPPLPNVGHPLYYPARDAPPMVACGRLERVLDRKGALAGYLHYDPC